MQPPFVNIHTHNAIGEGIELLNVDNYDAVPDKVFASAGLHPWQVGKCNHVNTIEKIEHMCQNGQLAAIGEIGLDRAIETDISLQMSVFETQLNMAKRYQLPIIIHCVRAYSDFLQILKNEVATTFIFHGFNGNSSTASQLISHGAMISFGANLLKNSKLQDVFRIIPNDCIFLETDMENVKIEDIYSFAARLKNVSLDEIKSVIFNNLKCIFGNRW